MNAKTKLGAAAALTAVAAVAVLATRGDGKSNAPDAGALQTTTVQWTALEVLAEASGSVEPVRIVEVKSKASGEALRVLVETGDVVQAGQLLAEIDPRDVQSSLDQAGATLESARVRARTTAAQAERMEALRKEEVITQQEYEASLNDAAAARSALVQAQADVRLASERRRDVTIMAPTTGTVIERAVEPGTVIASATNNVSGGTALFRIADLSRMQVRALVDETDMGQIAAGQPVRVTVEAYPGRTFRGTVQKVEPQAVVDQNVTMFPVIVAIENPDGALKPGMNAEVAVQVAYRPRVLTVPAAAVVGMRDVASTAAALGVTLPEGEAGPGGRGRGPGGGAAGARGGRERSGAQMGVVFVKTATGVEPRRVQLGVSDWESTEVLSGLEEGDQVVLVALAQAQAQRQESAARIRERVGGMVPGAGGGGAGGGGGGGGGPRR